MLKDDGQIVHCETIWFWTALKYIVLELFEMQFIHVVTLQPQFLFVKMYIYSEDLPSNTLDVLMYFTGTLVNVYI